MEENNQCFVAFFDVAKAFNTVWIDGLFKQIFDIGITGKTWRLLYRCYIDFQCKVRIGSRLSEPYELRCGIHQGGGGGGGGWVPLAFEVHHLYKLSIS